MFQCLYGFHVIHWDSCPGSHQKYEHFLGCLRLSEVKSMQGNSFSEFLTLPHMHFFVMVSKS